MGTLVDTGAIVTFIIVSFALALILIMKKDTIPAQIRRPLALIAIFLIGCSFFLMLFSFIHWNQAG